MAKHVMKVVGMFGKKDGEEPKKKNKEDDISAASAASQSGMNREMKRMMAKRERSADRLQRPTIKKKERTKPMQFLREVRGELGRVAWPTRSEVTTYTIVVLFTVAFFVAVIFGIDFAVSKGVLWLFSKGGN